MNINFKISIAQLGARMHYAVPRIFEEVGILEKFYTDFYVGNKNRLKKILQKIPFKDKMLKKVLTREENSIPPDKIKSFDFLGVKYWILQKISKPEKLPKIYAKIGKEFNELIIKNWEGNPDIVYGFNTASLELFKFLKNKGVKCVLEQMIVPRKIQRKLLLEEVEKWPDWQPWLKRYYPENDPLAEREEEEWKLADLIICGSEFVKENLIKLGVPEKKIKVIPYGVDLNKFKPIKKEPPKNRPLRVLFIGEVSLRKGIPYLLEALRILNTDKIQCKIAGKILINKKIVEKYSKYAEFSGVVPRNEVLKLYEWADVLILPSICEGSATVTYEALACGIPVICTKNTGSVIKHKEDGWFFPIGDIEKVVEFFQNWIKNPPSYNSEKVKKREKVSLKNYKNNLIKSIIMISH